MQARAEAEFETADRPDAAANCVPYALLENRHRIMVEEVSIQVCTDGALPMYLTSAVREDYITLKKRE